MPANSCKQFAPVQGQCRVCGCSEFDPCIEGCGWADRSTTLCTSDTCTSLAPVLDSLVRVVRHWEKGHAIGHATVVEAHRALRHLASHHALRLPVEDGGEASRTGFL